MEYIHYGCKKFDKNKFEKIKNLPERSKPLGGLWASRVDSKDGWKNWCEGEQYDFNLDDYFMFTLNEKSKVLTISNCKQLKNLPKKDGIASHLQTYLDFEEISKEYDAIEVLISKDWNLYFQLYGWDCDSILIMNPDVIEKGKEIARECVDIELDVDM